MDWAGWHVNCADCKIQILYCDPPVYYMHKNNGRKIWIKEYERYKDTPTIFGYFFIEFTFNNELFYFKIEIEDDGVILIGIYKHHPSKHVDRVTIKEWTHYDSIPNSFINALKSKQDLKDFCQKLILIS
jgi:hypothetical protein